MNIANDRETPKRVFEKPIDPIIHWPSGCPRLAPIIVEMRRLNPGLGLRCAISTYPAYEQRTFGFRNSDSSPFPLARGANNRIADHERGIQTLNFPAATSRAPATGTPEYLKPGVGESPH